jgi:hypothetical protein
MSSLYHEPKQKPMLTSIEELFDGLSPEGQYANLQFFLSRSFDKKELPAYYLLVSRDAFLKVRLDDLDFNGKDIELSIYDCSTNANSTLMLDINEKDFQCLLISWDDIKEMVLKDYKSDTSNDALLEFDF